MDKVNLKTIKHYKIDMNTGEQTFVKTTLVIDDGKTAHGLAALFEKHDKTS